MVGREALLNNKNVVQLYKEKYHSKIVKKVKVMDAFGIDDEDPYFNYSPQRANNPSPEPDSDLKVRPAHHHPVSVVSGDKKELGRCVGKCRRFISQVREAVECAQCEFYMCKKCYDESGPLTSTQNSPVSKGQWNAHHHPLVEITGSKSELRNVYMTRTYERKESERCLGCNRFLVSLRKVMGCEQCSVYLCDRCHDSSQRLSAKSIMRRAMDPSEGRI